MLILAAILLATALVLLIFPFYYLTLRVRKRLYDTGRIASQKFEIPVVCVGNITVGGTGKTPHTQMLVEALKDKYRLAVLSLGYGRKSKGFRIVEAEDDYTLCGDEPLQIKRNFPDVIVAVCKEREVAIRKLIDEYKVDYIILDDAYQYRKVAPSLNLLLVNYKRPISRDWLMPFGRLRDLVSSSSRAEVVIISKSPNFALEDGNELEHLAQERCAAEEVKWRKELKLRDAQKLYFSTLYYREPEPVFPETANRRYVYSQFAVCFSGIASDYEFKSQLVGTYQIEKSLKFLDHAHFSKRAVRKIVKLARLKPEAVVMTTEKDCMRLRNNKFLPNDVKERMFYLPVGCKIVSKEKEAEFMRIAEEGGIKKIAENGGERIAEENKINN